MTRQRSKLQTQISSPPRTSSEDSERENNGRHRTDISEMIATALKKQTEAAIEEIISEMISQIKKRNVNIYIGIAQ